MWARSLYHAWAVAEGKSIDVTASMFARTGWCRCACSLRTPGVLLDGVPALLHAWLHAYARVTSRATLPHRCVLPYTFTCFISFLLRTASVCPLSCRRVLLLQTLDGFLSPRSTRWRLERACRVWTHRIGPVLEGS